MPIKQLPCKAQCPWHGCHPDGKEYTPDEIFPHGVCPYLYHSLYPYFLGLLYGAEEMQNIWVCCPAEHGVNCYVRKDTMDDGWWTIYAEITSIGEGCPYNHYKGQTIIFPTGNKKQYLCPAGVNNIFPFLDLEVPSCINKKKIKCPDWKDPIYYDIT